MRMQKKKKKKKKKNLGKRYNVLQIPLLALAETFWAVRPN